MTAGDSKLTRFIFLDGLRGVAAFAVVILHGLQITAAAGPHTENIGLAVDFFFALSGFVVTGAYDDRLRHGMSIGGFLLRRLVRLYPMILAGVGLGVLAALIVGAPRYPMMLIYGISSALIVPGGAIFGGMLFVLNPPMWSLFYELVACALYALLLKLPSKITFLVLGAAAISLALAVLHSNRITSFGTFSGLTFLGGFLRVTVSFLTGVILRRFEIHHKVHSLPWFVPAGLLLAIFTAPIGGAIFHLLAVFLVLPSVLLLGASTTPGHDRLWKAVGDISYPIYLVHYPILILTNALMKGQPSALIVAVGAVAAVGASEIALALYDAPAREWLSTRLGLRQPGLPLN